MVNDHIAGQPAGLSALKVAPDVRPQHQYRQAPGAVLTYDVRAAGDAGRAPPLFILGSPMAASGFEQLVDHFTDRTVITYDPRGAERSTPCPTAAR